QDSPLVYSPWPQSSLGVWVLPLLGRASAPRVEREVSTAISSGKDSRIASMPGERERRLEVRSVICWVISSEVYSVVRRVHLRMAVVDSVIRVQICSQSTTQGML